MAKLHAASFSYLEGQPKNAGATAAGDAFYSATASEADKATARDWLERSFEAVFATVANVDPKLAEAARKK